MKALLTPDETTQDGHHPGEIVARDGEGEEGARGGFVDEAQKAQDDGDQDDEADHSHGLVADALAHVPEEVREGEGAVAGEGPALAGGCHYLYIIILIM